MFTNFQIVAVHHLGLEESVLKVQRYLCRVFHFEGLFLRMRAQGLLQLLSMYHWLLNEYRTCNRRLSHSSLCRWYRNYFLNILNGSSFGQTTLHARDSACPWQTLWNAISRGFPGSTSVLQLTKGFSCCKARNVENNRGFIFTSYFEALLWSWWCMRPLARQDFVGKQNNF